MGGAIGEAPSLEPGGLFPIQAGYMVWPSTWGFVSLPSQGCGLAQRFSGLVAQEEDGNFIG